MIRHLAALALLALPAAAEEPGFSLYDAVVDNGPIEIRPQEHWHLCDPGEPSVLRKMFCRMCRLKTEVTSKAQADPTLEAGAILVPEVVIHEPTYRFIQDPRELDAFGPQNSYAPGPVTGATKGTLSLDDLPAAAGRPREGLGKLFEDPQNLEAKRREGTVQYYDLDGDGRLDGYESNSTTQIGPLELNVKGRGDSAGFSPLETILPIRPKD